MSMLTKPSMTTLRGTLRRAGVRAQRRGLSRALRLRPGTWLSYATCLLVLFSHYRRRASEAKALGNFTGDPFGEAHHRVAVQQVGVDLGIGGQGQAIHARPERRHPGSATAAQVCTGSTSLARCTVQSTTSSRLKPGESRAR